MTVTVAAVDVTDEVQDKSITMRLNALDFVLVNPATVPTLDDAVAVDDPAWAGVVTSVETTEYTPDNFFVKVTATNTDEAAASAAPFGLSDATNDYRNLHVTRTTHDATTEIRGSLETFLPGLLPGHVFELTNARQGWTDEEFSIKDVTVTWEDADTPKFAISFGDPIVTLSVWLTDDTDNGSGILPITTTKITDGAVTTPKIATEAITATTIAAGAVTAEKLNAVLLLASLIKTADSGARVELDVDGFRAYSSDEELLVNIPTDGEQDVYVNARIAATELVVTGDAVFQGAANALQAGSVTVVQNFQQPPTQAPTLTQGWDTISVPAATSPAISEVLKNGWSLCYDAAGGAGGATKVFWTIAWDEATGEQWALELLASDRTVNRSIDLRTLGPVAYDFVAGLARHGSYLYVLYRNEFADFEVERYVAATLALDTTYNPVDMSGLSVTTSATGNAQICSDGTNLYIVSKGSGTATIKWNKYDDTMTKVGSTIDTSYSPFSGAVIQSAAAGNFDFGAFRMAIATDDYPIDTFNSTGTRQANEQFLANGNESNSGAWGLTYGDALGDGARFWSFTGVDENITKHSTWVWTSASSKYWVGYSWLDSVGTTHETTVGPRSSITMGRRKKLTVTTQAVPGEGGADEPDSRRIYMFPNATAPATTSLDLQATSTALTETLRTYDSGGAAPPTSNDFSSLGDPAELNSSGGEWSLKGDGTVLINKGLTGDDSSVQYILLKTSGTDKAKLGSDGTLRLYNTTDLTVGSNDHGLTVGLDSGDNIGIDNNEIMARNNGSAAILYLNKDGGADVRTGGGLTVDGGITASGSGAAIDMSGNGYMVLSERSDPAAPAANNARFYVRDNGSGKTQLVVRFSSGAIQVIATQP